MNIYVYSDESGVFDNAHNEYFVFGGLVFLTKESRDVCARKYIKAENDVRASEHIDVAQEVKACAIKNKYKNKLFRALNNQYRFGVVIEQHKVLQRIFQDKKSKQRYLDFAYKIAVKRQMEKLIRAGTINPLEVENMVFFVDEHTTATNGQYELREALLNEFKIGTFNWDFNKFFPPVFPNLKSLELKYCNSAKNPLVRASDIVANNILHHARSEKNYSANEDDLFVVRLP